MLALYLILSTHAAAPLDEVLTTELNSAMETLRAQNEPPHYLALATLERREIRVDATNASLNDTRDKTSRWLDVDLRVGTPELDSTHPLRGFSSMEGSYRNQVRVPLNEEGTDTLRHILWREMDRAYRNGVERIVMLRANQLVKVEEEHPSPDFEPRTGVQATLDLPEIELETKAWEAILLELSTQMDEDELVYSSGLSLVARTDNRTFVDSEGARLIHGTSHARLSLHLETMADDGDEISVFRAFDVRDPSSLPDAEALRAWTQEAMNHLKRLRLAPRAEPYSGPVVLRGKASGVFFHEVFGHRVEGHRQKRDDEGKTFADHVGKEILPPFINVYDDPRQKTAAGIDLNGHYAFDDEGVAGDRAELVKDGRFVGFLMGRSPIPGFATSNGHGRRMSGNAPVSRMANTIVEATKTLSEAQLRARLLKEIRAQGQSFGYIVSDIDGGFTITGRVMPNAFNVRANTTYRVYADGRPDELVRGIDLVGTPMVAFKSILAAGDTIDVFNGHCGAESGWVPVSAVAPDLLIRRLEFQLKEKGEERPPILPKPAAHDGHTDAEGDHP